MTEPLTPPEPGEDNWGEEMNAYLANLEERIAANVERIVALEEKPEYIYNSYPWTYNSGAPPATNGQVRFDDSDPQLVTVLDFRQEDGDGADRSQVFRLLAPGSVIRINDWNDAGALHRFNVSGPSMLDATNVQVPVTWESGAGTLPTGKVNVAFLVTLIV